MRTDKHYRIGQREAAEVVVQQNEQQFAVYPRHPRLFFRDTDIPTIQARTKTSHSEEWRKTVARVERIMKRPPAHYAARAKGWTPGRSVTFVAAITGEQKYVDWAVGWADRMVQIGPDQGIDDDYRGRLMSMAIVYDWLYHRLGEQTRKRILDSIVGHINKNWYFAERPNFIGGHSRWGNFALAAGVLAVVTERPDLKAKVLRVRQNWIHGYFPAQGWIAVDGGYHMGWAYSAPYTDARIHCVWTSATNECVYYPWRGQLPYFWFYGDRGDGSYPGVGDNYSNISRGDWATLFVSAGILKNRHAAWYVKKRSPEYRYYLPDILYADKTVVPLAPDDPASPLPLSRHFRRAGVVLMRDRWDKDTTLFNFKCSSFVSINHHHLDENSFTLSYRGRLAIDSGSYEKGTTGYGSPHWCNYFMRTIAHNCITVLDPNESFRGYRGSVSNDGGQKWTRGASRLEEIVPGGTLSIDGIVGYADEGVYAYASGDATKAYSSSKLKRWVRSVVYLRQPAGRKQPVVVVFDHVVSTNPGFKKRFLLHSVHEPTVAGSQIEIVDDGGRLQVATLLPKNAQFEKIGGRGKRFWVDGKNWGLNEKGMSAQKVRELYQWAGEWRVEISPSVPANEDLFLHVLAVSAKTDPTPAPACSLVGSESVVGAVACGHAVLFNPYAKPLSSGSYKLGKQQARRHIVLGVVPSRVYTLKAKGRRVSRAASTPGGSVCFSVPGGVKGRFEFVAGKPVGRKTLRRPEKQEARDAVSNVEPLEEHDAEVSEAREKARKGKYEEAAAAIGKIKAEQGKEVLERIARGFRAAGEMRKWIIAGVSEKRHEKVLLNVMGRRSRVTVVAADSRGIEVKALRSTVPLPWERLAPEELLRVSAKYAFGAGGKIPSERQALLDDFAFACGLEGQ